MKKTSINEISQLIKVDKGSDLEQAAAIAVVSSLLSSKAAQQQVSQSNWTSGSGLRQTLQRKPDGKNS